MCPSGHPIAEKLEAHKPFISPTAFERVSHSNVAYVVFLRDGWVKPGDSN